MTWNHEPDMQRRTVPPLLQPTCTTPLTPAAAAARTDMSPSPWPAAFSTPPLPFPPLPPPPPGSFISTPPPSLALSAAAAVMPCVSTARPGPAVELAAVGEVAAAVVVVAAMVPAAAPAAAPGGSRWGGWGAAGGARLGCMLLALPKPVLATCLVASSSRPDPSSASGGAEAADAMVGAARGAWGLGVWEVLGVGVVAVAALVLVVVLGLKLALGLKLPVFGINLDNTAGSLALLGSGEGGLGVLGGAGGWPAA